VDELPKIVFWLSKIGREGKNLSGITTNGRKAREAVEMLARRGLVETRKLGRTIYVKPTRKGLIALAEIERLEKIVSGPENPWLEIIADRARRRMGLEG